MAVYKYPQYLQQSSSNAYDSEHNPGSLTPHSGIYRCMGCGREIVSETGRPLPAQNHPQHTPQQGAIRWRLIVYSDGNPK
jgi:hypothetical protein